MNTSLESIKLKVPTVPDSSEIRKRLHPIPLSWGLGGVLGGVPKESCVKISGLPVGDFILNLNLFASGLLTGLLMWSTRG